MGKKSTKVLSGALATTSLLGGVMGAVPVFAATNLDAMYKSAFDAVMKAKEDESQESITAARKAIDELRKHKELQGFVGEFSKQADKVQQKLFDDFYSLLFVDGKKKDKIPQKDINKAREFVKSFDTFEGNKQYTASWSTAVDGFQQVLVVEAHDAVVKAMGSKDEKDVKAAEELVKELATSTNEDTKKEAAKYSAITVELQKEIQEEAAKLKVASVSAINAKEIKVTFNTKLDKTDINNKVKIGSLNWASQKLSDDEKTIELTANEVIDVTNATVVVEPIKTKADANAKTEKYVGLFTYKDEVAPKIVSVEAKASEKVAKEITVKVSEPVKTGALAKVNGTYASVDFNGTDKATITGLSLEAGKTHTLELINFEDLAGNKTVSEKASFTVTVDKEAPVATLSAKTDEGDKVILVTFNKSMDKDLVAAGISIKDESLEDVTKNAITVVEDTDNKQFKIPVNAPLYKDKDSRTLNVIFKDTIKDALGNKMVAKIEKVTLTKDTVKPVATGYNVIKEADGKVKAIEVTFSEGLAAEKPVVPTIVNENGVIIPTTEDGAFLGGLTAKAITKGDKKVVYTATTPAKVSGKFAFSFAKDLVSDLAETANKSDAFNYTIDFGKSETDATFKLEDSNINDTTTNVIQVTFPEAVKGGAVAGSATDLANYTLAGKPLPAGTTITLDSTQKIATIKLPASESVEKDDKAAVFTVANIKNLAGTKTLKTYTGTVEVKDNVKPVLQSAKILDNKTIELTYSEAMQVTGDGKVHGDFIIKQGTEALTLNDGDLIAEAVSGFDKKVKITIKQGTDTPGTPATVLDLTKDITVETKDSSVVVDKAGTPNGQKAEVKVTVAK